MMRKIVIIIILFCTFLNIKTQVHFSDNFKDETLRIDYFHSGNANEETFCIDKIYRYNKWAGNPYQNIQKSRIGEYKIILYDSKTNIKIFSKGYNSIFLEYKSTQPALEGKIKTYHESVLVPNPKNPVIGKIEKKGKDRKYHTIFSFEIDPGDYHINTENLEFSEGIVLNIIKNGDPHNKVDISIIGEGYTSREEEKFKTDLDFYINVLFNTEPYKSNKDKFNISGILPFSKDNGTDEPRKRIYRNTALNSSFNIFDTERYMLIEDNKALHDVASQVPYDAIMIMVNINRYGGGGIYNCQSVFTSENEWREYVFLHEFGHAFAGLADEYYSSDVSYIDLYPSGTEPVEANITALLNPDSVKWNDLLSPGIEIPTQWNKEIFDSLSMHESKLKKAKQDTLQYLYDNSVSDEIIEKIKMGYDKKIETVRSEIDNFLNNHPLRDKVGVFEGAGYLSNGLYRPTINSLMHRFERDKYSFREVNERAILEIIEYYTSQE